MSTGTVQQRPTLYGSLMLVLRQLDQMDGQQLLERFLERPQYHADLTYSKIIGLSESDTPQTCPDDLLQYLKWHVGLTSELWSITDRLDVATLRKLIALAIPMWKTKGTRNGLINVVRTLTGQSAWYMDWFDYRFLIDEDGPGGWVIGEEVSDHDEWFVSLRVMDDGTLDEQLLVDMSSICRPAGERFEIALMDFMDRFNDVTAPDRWVKYGSGDPAYIESQELRIPPATTVAVISPLAQPWQYTDWFHTHLFRLASSGNCHYTIWITGYEWETDHLTGYVLEAVDAGAGLGYQLTLIRIADGAETVWQGATSGGIAIDAGTDYELKVHTVVHADVPEIGIKIWIDDVLQLDYVDSDPGGGPGDNFLLGLGMLIGWPTHYDEGLDDPTEGQIFAVASNDANTGDDAVDDVHFWRQPMRYALLGPDGVEMTDNFLVE